MIVSLVGLISLPALGALVDRLSLPTSLILLGVGFSIGGAILMWQRPASPPDAR